MVLSFQAQRETTEERDHTNVDTDDDANPDANVGADVDTNVDINVDDWSLETYVVFDFLRWLLRAIVYFSM